jgi:LmbE family N-acetylglucosaminyl deacetylase
MGADRQHVDQASWGLLQPGTLNRVVVVSPHFDDAALGAAHLISAHPGTTVITVLGGRPPAYPAEPTDWDACGGFVAGDDVVARRREEDGAAMAFLGATPVWLEFPDHQYLAPEAGLLARVALGAPEEGPAWFCYEDHGYKHIPGILAWRVAKLFKSGLWPTPAVVPVELDMARKRLAIELYKSQVPPLQRDHVLDERLDANVPEQHWRLEPPPRGWERLMDMV